MTNTEIHNLFVAEDGYIHLEGSHGDIFSPICDDDDGGTYLHFSDYTVIRAEFDEVWKFEITRSGSYISVTKSHDLHGNQKMELTGVEYAPVSSRYPNDLSFDEVTESLKYFDYENCELEAYELMDIYKQLVWSKGKK